MEPSPTGILASRVTGSERDHETPRPLAAVAVTRDHQDAEVLMALRSIGAFVAAFVACVTAIGADEGESFQVDIRLRIDPSIASRRIVEGLKTETETLWAPYGVRLRWADASTSATGGVSLEASVERRFERRRRAEWPPVLGRVVVGSDAPAWRPIRLSTEATESVLALRTTGPSTTKGIVSDRELARALGRVLAHEIGHVLLGPPYHDRAGLMRANFDVNELAEPNDRPFRLTCTRADHLGSRLSALTGYPQRIPQQVPRLDPEGVRGTRREVPGGEASCIAASD
jgi:hypothetical protein